MTKKDFIALADALREAKNIYISENDNFQRGKVAGVKVAIEYVADALQRDNPRFKRDRWLGYINGENGPNGGELHYTKGIGAGVTHVRR